MSESELHSRRLLVFLVLAAVALTAAIVRPFWEALFLAAVLAATLSRPMEWLSAHLGRRRHLAAGLLVVAVLLAVLLPIAGLGAVIVNHVLEGVRWLRHAIESEGVWGLVQRLPGPIERAAQEILRAMDAPENPLQRLGERGTQAAAAVGGVLAATGGALFQAAMMLIALFFFLSDGQRLVDWIDAQVPLRPGQFRTLLEDFRQTSISVLLATVGTAGLQTATALVGYLIARAPNVLFLTLTTFVFALIPALGGTLAVIAVGVLLLLTAHVAAGVFLLAYGIVFVSIADNFARPFLLKGGMELHGGLVFFALLGGLASFGAIGLILGPLVLTFLIATTRMYRREFASDLPARSAQPPRPTAPPPAA